jgi:uncharacterized protein
MRSESNQLDWRVARVPKGVFALAVLAATGLVAQVANRPLTPPPPDVIQQLGLVVPMRDGIRLAADLYMPRTGGRFGTILIRTPYNRKAGALGTYQFFTHRGYAVLLEDVRGRYASQGVFGPTEQEGPDSSDTMNWIATQPWSNGRVAMAGSSYLGMVQWWAAVQDNPHLVTISPMCAGDDEYLDRFYSPGGALKLGHRLLWLAQNLTPPSKVRPVFTGYIWHLPERTDDIAAMGVTLPLWRSALDHPSYDSYWKPYSLREQLRRVAIPILSLGGWFDNYAESDLDAFSRLSKRRDRIETWIGPWAHNPGLKFATRDFGPQALVPIRLKQAEWFDYWMKGEAADPDAATAPSLHIFVMGPNIWREEHEWPLARTRYTPLYIASKGHANSNAGDGALSWAPVRKSQSDTFTYDPKNPVPTTGGAICCDPRLLPPGPLDQTPVETRDDVLVYTSPPLAEDLEVTGPVRTVLYVATSANDTDFTAKLVDLGADGRPLLVSDGIQRLRYRLSLEKPVFVKRNTAYQINIDAGVTSYVFAAGHRIRLEVSSSNFPRFDRNLNSAQPISDEIKIVKAKQTIYHDKSYPSALILPVIPAKAK